MLRALNESSRIGWVRAAGLTSSASVSLSLQVFAPCPPGVEPRVMRVRHPAGRRDGAFAGRIVAWRIFAGGIVAWLEHQWVGDGRVDGSPPTMREGWALARGSGSRPGRLRTSDGRIGVGPSLLGALGSGGARCLRRRVGR